MFLKKIATGLALVGLANPVLADVRSEVLSNYDYVRSYNPGDDRCVAVARFSGIKTFPNASVYGSNNSVHYEPISFTVTREEDGTFTIEVTIEQLPQYIDSCEKVNAMEVLVSY